MGILHSADGAAVLRYAVGLAEMEALIEVRTLPAIDKKEWHARFTALCATLAKLEACFGLTPADRTRVSSGTQRATQQDESPEAKFLKLAQGA